METRIQELTTYRDVIDSVIRNQDGSIPRGRLKQLAQDIRCHPSFITHYMQGKCEFSIDQAFFFAKASQFNHEQTKHLIELVICDKAANFETKKFISEHIVQGA